MEQKLVSIIVSTKNEEKNIEPLLKSCKNQTYPNTEIILVDNNSTDKTKEIASHYTDKIFNIGPERSIQRNYGVNTSSGYYVVILDADMQMEPTVISDCVKKCEINREVKSVIIPEISYGEGFWAKSKALERNCYIGDDTIEAARFFIKDAYLEVGGFNERMVAGEDWDLTRRIKSRNWKVDRIQSYIRHNEGRLDPLKSMRKKFYYSIHSAEYLDDNQYGIKEIILFIFRPAYFRNWKLLIKDPVHTIGFVTLKFLELTAGLFGILRNKLHKSDD